MMKLKSTLLLALGVSCFVSNHSSARVLSQAECEIFCTSENCKNKTILGDCMTYCADRMQKACPKTTKQPQTTQETQTQTPPPLPPERQKSTAAPQTAAKNEFLISADPKIKEEEINFLEKIAHRLIYINNIEWEQQFTIMKNSIDILRSKPEDYDMIFKEKDEKFVPGEEFTKIMEQMKELTLDTKKQVNNTLLKVKEGEEKDLLKAFSDINGAIVLATKNVVEKGQTIKVKITNQNQRIERLPQMRENLTMGGAHKTIEAQNKFNTPDDGKKPSLGAKVKGGMSSIKKRLTGKEN